MAFLRVLYLGHYFCVNMQPQHIHNTDIHFYLDDMILPS